MTRRRNWFRLLPAEKRAKFSCRYGLQSESGSFVERTLTPPEGKILLRPQMTVGLNHFSWFGGEDLIAGASAAILENIWRCVYCDVP